MSKYKEIIRNNLFYILFFIAVSALAFLFVPSADDWGWGSKYGIELLRTGFKGYNGRYLGNLCAIAFLRVPHLLPFIKGLTVAAALKLVTYYSDVKNKEFMFIAAALLIVPTGVFYQGFVWTAGYSNYCISAVLIILGFRLTMSSDKQSVFRLVLIFIIGFAGQLFMETYTLTALAISLMITLFTIFKYKRVIASRIAHLIGCIGGAVLMFSNSVYISAFNGESKYQQVSAGGESGGLLLTVLKNLPGRVMCNLLVSCCCTVFALVIISIVLLKRKGRLKGKLLAAVIFALAASLLSAASGAALFIKSGGDVIKICAGIALAFLFIPCAAAWGLCLNKESARKVLICFAAVAMLSLPFVFVYPVGGRCFVAVNYILIVIFGEYYKALNLDDKSAVKVKNAFAVLLCAVMIFDFAGYTAVAFSTRKKLETIRTETEKGNRTVAVEKTKFGFMEYSVDAENKSGDYMEYFCDFYGFSEDTVTVYK